MIRILLFLVLFGAAAGSVVHADPRLRFVADEWPPYLGADLPNKVLSPHVRTTILQSAAYDFEVQNSSWVRIVSGTKTEDHHLVGCPFFDRNLCQAVVYSPPIHEHDIQLLRRNSLEMDYDEPDGLRLETIVEGDGYYCERKFGRSGFLRKRTVTTRRHGVQMVGYSWVRLTLHSAGFVEHFQKSNRASLQCESHNMSGAPEARGMYLEARKSLPARGQLRAGVNIALAEIRPNRTLESTIDRYRVQ